MWIFTETGFVSAVRKSDAPSKVTARARDKQSLQVLSELAETEIIHTPYADYGYRVIVADAVFKGWLETTVDMLDYDNFKNRIWKTRGNVFHDALGNVWTEMLAVADSDEREGEEYEEQ
jgi:hypothetical protein